MEPNSRVSRPQDKLWLCNLRFVGGGRFPLLHIGDFNGCKWLIVTVDVAHCGATCPTLRRVVADGHSLLSEFGLCPFVIGDAATGGATDAQHLLCLGDNLSSPCVPCMEVGLCRTVQNVLDGGVKGWFPTVAISSLLVLAAPPHAVLWHKDVLRPEGLFPCWFPNARVYCPLHRTPTRWAVRQLTIGKTSGSFRCLLQWMASLMASAQLGDSLLLTLPLQRSTLLFFASCGA
jgi:hypothetical protein